MKNITIKGAREHNLKGQVTLPRDELIGITGGDTGVGCRNRADNLFYDRDKSERPG